jgi:SAM-dependent methyltransferase
MLCDASFYYFIGGLQVDITYFDQVRTEIYSLLPPVIGTVMEVGCATGLTLQWLKNDQGAKHTIGVELSPTAAKAAESRCDEVYSINIVDDFLLMKPFENKVNLLLLLDILEHLSDPWQTLGNMKSLLSNDGIVIASIPNVRSIKVLGPLIFKGKWEYAASGILDRTHFRFFTKKSVIELFEKNGFDIIDIRPNGAMDFSKAKTLTGKLVAAFNLATFHQLEGFLANQWLISAKPAATGNLN